MNKNTIGLRNAGEISRLEFYIMICESIMYCQYNVLFALKPVVLSIPVCMCLKHPKLY